jgi:hypothetical protein
VTDPDVIGGGEQARASGSASRGRENPILGWAKAVVLGVRDTAHDIVEEGKKGAQRTYEARWQEYDEKTKRRRTPSKR